MRERENLLFRTAKALRKSMPENAEDQEKYKNHLLAATKDIFGNDRGMTDAMERIIQQLKW